MAKIKKPLDRGLLVTLFLLMGIGLVQVYSSSFIFAIESRGNGLHFFSRQLAFTFISVFVLFTTALMPWKKFERWGFLLWWVAILGLAATFVPSLSVKAGGAARWVRLLPGLNFEPGELLKIAFSVLVATFLSRRSSWMGQLEWWIKIPFIALPLAMLLKQPDFGTFAICCAVGLTILFAFGLPWRYILGSIAVSLPVMTFLIMSSPYRMARVSAFLDPWADPEQKGFQVIQSLLSFHSGGLWGAGLGQGQGKLFFLPEAHTDFTMAVLGEEMGFIGYMIVLLLYGFLVLRGLQISVQAKSHFDKALSIGLTMTFAFSVFINVGVVLGLLPTKGLTLPFLSYGGSSLVMCSLLFGLLLNIERGLVPDAIRRPHKKVAKGYKVNRRSMRSWS